MLFYLKGHQNYQKLKIETCVTYYIKGDFGAFNVDILQLIKHHTVPHLKGVNSGLEPYTSHGGGSNFIGPIPI